MGTLLRTNKGARLRLLDGYSMLYHYATPTCEYWRCSKYATCGARAKLSLQSGEFQLMPKSQHNHVVDPTSPVKRERVQILKDSAKANLSTPSSSLAADAQKGLQPSELQSFPSLRALQQRVSTVRKVDVTPGADKEPKHIVLPDVLKTTERNGRFLIVDSRDAEPDLPIFFAFGSDKGAEMLQENKRWSVDGTFFASPRFFDSLLIICCLVGTAALPAVYIVLPDRRLVTYERALRAVFASDAFRNARPDAYVCDFEAALSGAMRKLFPDALVLYCHFHLAKNAWLHIQKKGLVAVYGVEKLRVLLRSLAALAFLPPEEIPDAYDDVCNALTEAVKDLSQRYIECINNYVRYFARTYVGDFVRGSRMAPRYEPAEWSVFQRTLDNQPRTNNASEGYNASLNRTYPKANMVMSQFLIRIKHEEEKSRNIYDQHEMNPADPVRGRRSKISHREANLRALVEEYASKPADGRDKLKFLSKVQYHLSATAFDRLDPKYSVVSTAADAMPLHNSSATPSVEQRMQSASQPSGRRTSPSATRATMPSNSQPAGVKPKRQRIHSPAEAATNKSRVAAKSSSQSPSTSTPSRAGWQVPPTSATSTADSEQPSTSAAAMAPPSPASSTTSMYSRSGRQIRPPSPFTFF